MVHKELQAAINDGWNQNKLLLLALKLGYVIDPMFALRELGIYRLSARIHELRNDGHEIYRANRKFKSRKTRNKGHVAAYWIKVKGGNA